MRIRGNIISLGDLLKNAGSSIKATTLRLLPGPKSF